MVEEVKRKAFAFGLLAILLATTLSALIYYGYVPTVTMKTFSSYDQLNSFITNNTPKGYPSNFEGPIDRQFLNGNNQGSNGFGRFPSVSPSAAPQAAVAPVSGIGAALSSATSVSYSKTNIQVAGVDEADVVKTDGYYIYLLSVSKNGVYIIDANPQNANVVSKISFDNSTSLAGIYLSQDGSRLAVLGSKYATRTETTHYTIGGEVRTYTREYFVPEETRTFVKVYDVSDKANPVLARDFAASGSYFNSRMIGNYVYTVLSQPVRIINQTVTLPSIYKGAECSTLPPSSIYYVDREDSYYNYYTFTSIVGVNILNDAQKTANLTIMMGGASNIYASTTNFYVTYPGVSTSSVWSGQSESSTEIHRINVAEDTLTFDAQATVSGAILNQYSMDEYNGYFRIATTTWRNSVLQNNVYVLNANLTTVGKLENLASGENLHSARFIGDKCYLVTFKKTDPLFVIDLSQPAYPSVLGELKIPGYSDYLHPFDETHLIGVGKETVEASQGDFAWYQGIKLSLFDVSNISAPTQMAKVVIGDRGSDSPVLSDPKAFLFDKAKNLLVIPVSLALINKTAYEPSPSTYGTTVWQGAYVFNLNLSDGFQLKGNITHIEDPSVLQNGYWRSYSSWITRSLYIGNVLYTISDGKIQLNSLEDLTPIAKVELK